MKVAPCKDCDERHLGCHSQCERYKEYDAERKAIRAEKNKKLELMNNYFDAYDKVRSTKKYHKVHHKRKGVDE